MKKKLIPGINIQWPISTLILSGQKTVETRTYPIPSKYVGQTLALIETPGPSKTFKARVTAIVKFGPPFKYKSAEDFYKDCARHRVDLNSKWRWTDLKPKWGWPVKVVKKFVPPIPVQKRTGIVFTKEITLPAD